MHLSEMRVSVRIKWFSINLIAENLQSLVLLFLLTIATCQGKLTGLFFSFLE